MDDQSITRALKNVIESVEESVRSDRMRLTYLTQFSEDEGASPTISEFIRLLRGTSELDLFDGLMQVTPGSSSRVEIWDLANWLISRAGACSSKEAVSDLQRYLKAEVIPCKLIHAICGLKVSAPCDLVAGISLVPWEQLEDTYGKRSTEQEHANSLLGMHPVAALVQEYSIPKLHFRSDEDYELGTRDDAGVEDARLCISMIGPFAPHPLATWLEPPLWAPIKAGSSKRFFSGGHIRPSIDNQFVTHIDPARILFSGFMDLSEKKKLVLRLPMRHLVRAMQDFSNVDASINLGIALEALFLNDTSDDRSELTYRLRVRAARWLGNTIKNRRELFRLVGELYGLRSSAIHTGKVSDTRSGKPTSEILDSGFKLTANAIRRIILEGTPDWTLITLN